jgi:glycosyltransferase involved in cell wall biosynthesis
MDMSDHSARTIPTADGGVFAFANRRTLSVSPAALKLALTQNRSPSGTFNVAAHWDSPVGQTVALPSPDAQVLFRDDGSGLVSAKRASPFGSYPSARMSRVGGQPRTAIIHYWLVGMRGGERVLERLLRLFPNADVFTHVYDPAAVSQVIRDRPVRTTFVQHLPGARRHYQKYLPLMPMALEQLDLRGYDLIISSESGPAKGVICPPGALHVCYCHSPMRYLWDHYTDYRRAAGLLTRLAMPLLTHGLRSWDHASAARVDRFMANSTFIQQRIEKAYRRPSTVVYPPVDMSLFHQSDDVEARYLWVGQLTSYKRPDLAVDAFNELGLPLLMVGDGEMMRELRRRARLFTAEEDFGMVPVEAMASGRPVLAYGNGGALDTVLPGITGLFFQEQSKDSLIAAVEAMEAWLPHFQPAHAVRNAERFSPERFDEGVLSVIAGAAG